MLTISKSKPIYIICRGDSYEPTMTVLRGERVAMAFYLDEETLVKNDKPVAISGSVISSSWGMELTGGEEALGFGQSILAVLNHSGETRLRCNLIKLEEPAHLYFIKAGGIGDEWSICDRQAYYAHFWKSDPIDAIEESAAEEAFDYEI